jgi:hypothetical protein
VELMYYSRSSTTCPNPSSMARGGYSTCGQSTWPATWGTPCPSSWGACSAYTLATPPSACSGFISP